MVPKLIHPLPPNLNGTPKTTDSGDEVEEEPPTPHPMNDTWMGGHQRGEAPHPSQGKARQWPQPGVLRVACSPYLRTTYREARSDTWQPMKGSLEPPAHEHLTTVLSAARAYQLMSTSGRLQWAVRPGNPCQQEGHKPEPL